MPSGSPRTASLAFVVSRGTVATASIPAIVSVVRRGIAAAAPASPARARGAPAEGVRMVGDQDPGHDDCHREREDAGGYPSIVHAPQVRGGGQSVRGAASGGGTLEGAPFLDTVTAPMRLTLTDDSLLPDLLAHLRGNGCVAYYEGGGIVAVRPRSFGSQESRELWAIVRLWERIPRRRSTCPNSVAGPRRTHSRERAGRWGCGSHTIPTLSGLRPFASRFLRVPPW